MKKVSIIVPVYNVELYLKKCIDSLINQTLEDIEIILINDGSTDSSKDICEIYAKLDSRIILVNQKNYGQSYARNRGIELSVGEYILFVDSDDYISLDTCQKLYSISKKNNLDILHGDLLNDQEKMLKNKKFRKIKCEEQIIDGLQYLQYSLQSNSYDIVPFLYFVKRTYLINNNIKFLEGCYYEDQEYTLKLLTNNKNRFMKIRYPYYYYRMNREGSTTNIASTRKFKDSLKIILKMREYILNKEVSIDKKIYMYMLLSQSLYHLSDIWLRLNEQDKREMEILIDKHMLELSDCFNKSYPKMRIKIQNILFIKNRFLLKLINQGKYVLQRGAKKSESN